MTETGKRKRETRYARQQKKLRDQERHANIVQKLSRGVVEDFEAAVLSMEEPLPCAAEGIPSRWTDWDLLPENREPQDGIMPTGHEARDMCAGCPLMEDDLCYRYALATDKQHGVWGGRRIYQGGVVSEDRESPDLPNRERRPRGLS